VVQGTGASERFLGECRGIEEVVKSAADRAHRAAAVTVGDPAVSCQFPRRVTDLGDNEFRRNA